jgi:predicted outer membrane repeat protein
LSAVIPGSQTTLRAAITEANAAGAARSIYVGRGTYNLTLNGSGGDTQGDLDITGNVTIVGAGAGATIINAGTLTTPDRVFDINGANRSLHLSRVTVTGGNTSSFGGTTGIGGGISVIGASAALTLNDSAVVGNTGKSFGGGIYSQGTTTITRSVIAGNHLASSVNGGGGVYATLGTVSIGSTIIANNTATAGPQDIYGTDPYWTSQGNNLLTSIQIPLVDNFSQPGDYVGNADYVVTSLVDSFNHTDDNYALSLREAIDLANEDDGHTSGTAETIWLPAWNFVLTRERQNGVGNTDTDVAWGDLDIKDSLNIRGITASLTRVQWARAAAKDAAFDLLGDYDGNGLADSPDSGDVGGRDMLMWQRQVGQQNGIGVGQSSADGDDDGDVDSDDLVIWQNYYGNYLMLTNLTEILA